MNKLVMEIGVEEIPSIYIDKALFDLKNIAINELKKQNIEYCEIHTFGTPRRLGIFIKDIADKQRNILKKIKGPSAKISLNENGIYQKPAIKFAQSHNAKLEDLIIEKTDKGEYLFVENTVKGENTEKILPKICTSLINGINFAKSMRWGNNSLRFIRPIRWLLALYNNDIIPINLEGIKSDRITYGHRLLSPEAKTVDCVDSYFKIMRGFFVIIEPEIRKDIILSQISELIKDISGKINIEKKLLDEVKNLVEYPRVLIGEFDKEYLVLPDEVLKSVMIKHQKYFPVYSDDGSLLPYFFVVINGNEDRFKDVIISGNERVLKARLEDAKFFYKEDQRISEKHLKPMDKNVNRLKDVVYQENLGSMHDKVERLIVITENIGKKIKIDNDLMEILKRSSFLCKSDLVSEMVKEFPELQGIMGKEYSKLQGEDNLVAEAIFEHYLPRFSDDDLPKTICGNILSIADKIDNITACFINDLVPDGSQDPYALRRQSLGIINIILLNNFDISIDDIINLNINLFVKNENKIDNIKNDDMLCKIKNFILQRFRYLLIEKGYKYDVIDSVITKSPQSINDALLRIKTVQSLYDDPAFSSIITAANRTNNLSKNATCNKINPLFFVEKEEKDLYKKYIEITDKIKNALERKRYKDIFDLIVSMNDPVNYFFDRVLVMDEDEIIRNNRLTLLKNITNMYYIVADLSKISISKEESN